MIFYFSGTGNSLWVAKQISTAFNEKLISISDELNNSPSLTYNLLPLEKIFFVFPVHSWGPAILVSRFIKQFNLSNYKDHPIYTICTCGDECGYTDKKMTRLLEKKSYKLTASYSIKMPNNYILMRGFGVDSKEVEKEKLTAAPFLLQEIIKLIQTGEKEIKLYEKGHYAWVKSQIVYPLFSKFAIGRNSFYATNQCTGCGLCAKICPTNTITFTKDFRPEWNNTCVQCTACIHRCPARAIEYGKITQNQGRYHHPLLLSPVIY